MSFEIRPPAGKYKRNFADLTLHVKNSGEKRVKALRLGVRFDDASVHSSWSSFKT